MGTAIPSGLFLLTFIYFFSFNIHHNPGAVASPAGWQTPGSAEGMDEEHKTSLG